MNKSNCITVWVEGGITYKATVRNGRVGAPTQLSSFQEIEPGVPVLIVDGENKYLMPSPRLH